MSELLLHEMPAPEADNDEDIEALMNSFREVAGFIKVPVTPFGRPESSLCVHELHAQLQMISDLQLSSIKSSNSPAQKDGSISNNYQVGAAPDVCTSTTEAIDSLSMSHQTSRRLTGAEGCEATSLPVGAPTTIFSHFTDDDLRREYGDGDGFGNGTLVIAFGGLVQGMGGVALHEFVSVCKRAGCRTLFVRDPLQSWYLRAGGVDREHYDALLRLLRCELQRLQPTKIVTIGASMGGYAALRAGMALAASHILIFGAQVYIDPSHRLALELPPMFFDEQLRALKLAADEAGMAMEPAYWQWTRACQREGRGAQGVHEHREGFATKDERACEPARDRAHELNGLLTHEGGCDSRAHEPPVQTVAPLAMEAATETATWAATETATWAATETATWAAAETAIELHVGEDAAGDVREAALLREACLASACAGCTVAVHAHAGLGHALVKDLRDAGFLEMLIRSII